MSAIEPGFRITLLAFVAGLEFLTAAHGSDFAERRNRAASEFRDGIVLLHASSEMSTTADGFRQDPFFYYFTGLENTVGAVLAIDGKTKESWLFLPSHPPFVRDGLEPEVKPGLDAEQRLRLAHVVDGSELAQFLSSRSGQAVSLYFASGFSHFDELPEGLAGAKSPGAPAWLQLIVQKWPAFEAANATRRVRDLMRVQDDEEIAALRAAAKATVTALMAGIHEVKPATSQRLVEAAVANACWRAGAHGASFWPWAMSGESGVFPRPFTSFARYDHLNSVLRAGDLLRLDVGCEWNHYQGDLGRTVPVSGHFTVEQRELWNIFVAAYQAGAKSLKAGVTEEQVFTTWQQELLRHRESAKSSLAQRAIDSWSERAQVPFWQVHTSNLDTGSLNGPMRAGTTINFEPIASIDGQGYFLEDMYLITESGAELLTPGVPYSAEAIEAAMRK